MQEFGCTLLGSLPKTHRDRLTKELHDIIRCIRQQNESDTEKTKEDKSASMTELKTPEKLYVHTNVQRGFTLFRNIMQSRTHLVASHGERFNRPLL